MNPKVFKNILKIIGLVYKKQYEDQEVFINTYLLSNRNAIAHGSKELFKDEQFELEIKSLKKLRDVTLVIIENFRDELITFATEKLFLKSNNDKLEALTKNFEEKLEADFKEIVDRYN